MWANKQVQQGKHLIVLVVARSEKTIFIFYNSTLTINFYFIGFNVLAFLDAIAFPSAYPVSQWVSGLVIVSDFGASTELVSSYLESVAKFVVVENLWFVKEC